MAQQYIQPNKRPRKNGQEDDSDGIFPSFYKPDQNVSSGAQSSINDIDRVLAQNDSLKQPLSGDDIRSAEESGNAGSTISSDEQTELDQLGEGFKEETERFGKAKSLLRKVASNRKQQLIGGGLIGTLIASILAFLFISLPLKVQHIVNNLQFEFFASAEQATDDMTNNLFSHYVIKQLVPGMVANNCTSTAISKNCVNTSTSDSIVGVLYNGWRDGRLEQRMADRGIEIKKQGNSFFIKTPSTTGELGEKLGDFNESDPDAFKNSAFQKMNRSDLRKTIRSALKQDTKWDRVMYRYKVGGMMERKYGVKRCLIACDTRDKFNDSVDAKKLAFKAYLVERVIEPRNEMMSLIFSCGFDSFKCAEVKDADNNGEKLTEYEINLRKKLADYRSRYGDRKVEELKVEAQKLSEKGAFEYMSARLLGDVAAKTLAKFIPWIGWIDLGATVIETGQAIGPAITKLTYVTNATTAVAIYGMYRTNADEIKTGQVDATMVGAVAESLSPTNGVDRKDQGGAGAEGSPLYSALMGSGTTTAFNPFGSKAYAAGTGYRCEDNDDKPPPNGEPVCRVERLDNKTTAGTIANDITAYYNHPLNVGGVMFEKMWNDCPGIILTVIPCPGKIIDMGEAAVGFLLEQIIKLIPGDPIAQITALLKPLIETFMKYIIKPTITNFVSGARIFHEAAKGADEAGNSFTHYSLGGAQISDEEAFAIRSAREAERRQEFNDRSMFARMFSTDTQYSLVSKMALATPGNGSSGIAQSMLSTITNPLSTAVTSMGSTLSGRPVSADNSLTEDPFGITQYGYPADDPVFTQDPEKYWEDNDCDNPETIKAWGNRASSNPDTEMQDHAPGDTEGCLLIKSAAGSSGALFTDGVLSSEELNGTDGNPTSPIGETTEFRVASFNIETTKGAPEASWKARLQKSTNFADTNKLEIIGMQETETAEQFNAMKSQEFFGAKYDVWPEQANGDNQTSSKPILWDKLRFERVKTDTIEYPRMSFDAPGRNQRQQPARAPIVKLREIKSDREFYVINTHNAAFPDYDIDRYNSAAKYRDKITSLKAEGLPIIFTGDFNEGVNVVEAGDGANRTYQGKRENLFYCIITKDNLMQLGIDNLEKNAGTCPRTTNDGVDHVYVSPELEVTNYRKLPGGHEISGSDHKFVTIADIKIPGSGYSDAAGTVVSANGMTFPLKTTRAAIVAGVDGSIWCYASVPNCHHDYNAADIHAPTGTVVVAAKKGTVVSARDNDSSSVGSRVTIAGDDGRLYYYAHMGEGTIRVKAGAKVVAGSEIGKVGTSADAVGTAPHLHIDVLPGSFKSRPNCSGAACNGYPFLNIQTTLAEVFKAVP